jgi:hypothetical protein
MGDFRSTPHDGHHSPLDPDDDWRGGGGIGGLLDRMVSYGNWAGPGNRVAVEQGDYIAKQRAQDPSYDETRDPVLMNDPRYAPIDGLDAAATRHDAGYTRHLGDANMFGWEGIRNTREDDRQLAADTQAEMDRNGSKYSDESVLYSEGLRGYFGSRAMGMDAVDWAGDRAGEASQGIGSFLDQAGGWDSLDEAGTGIYDAASGAGNWLANTASDAWNGASNAASSIGALGPGGIAGAVGGFGNVAVAGGVHLAEQAWEGAKGIGNDIADGASRALEWFGF